MKPKLSRIRSPWRHLFITLMVNSLFWLSKLAPRRARIHWIGRHNRPRRRERALFVITFLFSMPFLATHDFMLWATAWGGGVALFINLHTIYSFIPRKPYHWVNAE